MRNAYSVMRKPGLEFNAIRPVVGKLNAILTDGDKGLVTGCHQVVWHNIA